MAKCNYRCIKIDPFKKTVEEVYITDQDEDKPYASSYYDQIYKFVGTNETGHLSLDKFHSSWHDDVGALKPWDQQEFFQAPWYPSPLAGIHLITGVKWVEVDDDGYKYPEDRPGDVKLDVELVRQSVFWMDKKYVRIPATRFTTFDEKGQAHTKTLGGDTMGDWTYKDQPK